MEPGRTAGEAESAGRAILAGDLAGPVLATLERFDPARGDVEADNPTRLPGEGDGDRQTYIAQPDDGDTLGNHPAIRLLKGGPGTGTSDLSKWSGSTTAVTKILKRFAVDLVHAFLTINRVQIDCCYLSIG